MPGVEIIIPLVTTAVLDDNAKKATVGDLSIFFSGTSENYVLTSNAGNNYITLDNPIIDPGNSNKIQIKSLTANSMVWIVISAALIDKGAGQKIPWL